MADFGMESPQRTENTVQADRLTPKQGRLLDYLLQGASVRAAAQACGVSPRTAYRWLSRPKFQSALRAGQEQAMGDAVRRLDTSSSIAITTLRQLCSDPSTPASTRRAAASDLLLIPARLRAMGLAQTIEARIAELEGLAQGRYEDESATEQLP
jgi:transposase-like protein